MYSFELHFEFEYFQIFHVQSGEGSLLYDRLLLYCESLGNFTNIVMWLWGIFVWTMVSIELYSNTRANCYSNSSLGKQSCVPQSWQGRHNYKIIFNQSSHAYTLLGKIIRLSLNQSYSRSPVLLSIFFLRCYIIFWDGSRGYQEQLNKKLVMRIHLTWPSHPHFFYRCAFGFVGSLATYISSSPI